MQNEMTLRIEGADKIIDKLSKFHPKLQQAAGKKSARRAMAVVRAAARERVRQLDEEATPERIWKNVFLQQSRRKSKAAGGVVMRVGILGGARTPYGKDADAEAQPGGDTRHWRFVELGTEGLPARPFLLPALERNAQAVLSTLVAELNNEITRIAAER